MALPPELLALLAGNDLGPMEPRMSNPTYLPPPEWKMPPLEPYPNQTFPEQPSGDRGFWGRLADTYADNPTNFQPGGSQIEQFLAAALNSGSRSYSARRAREAESSPSSPSAKLALARINAANLKSSAERDEKNLKIAESNRSKAREVKRDQRLDRLDLLANNPEELGRRKAEQERAYNMALYGTPLPPDKAKDGLTAGDLDPATLDMVARTYKQTGNLPPLGMGAAGLRAKILQRAAQIDPNADIGSAQAGYKADSAALSQIQKNIDAVSAFKRTALSNADLMLSLSKGIPETGVPLLNEFVRFASAKAGGNVEMQKFRTALAVVQPEFARILSNPNLTGQLTDAARHEMQAVIDGNFTRDQLAGAVKVLKIDSENREREYKAQADAIRARISERRGDPAGASKVVRWGRDANGNPVRLD